MHAPPVGPGRAGATVYLSLHADTDISNISDTSMLHGMKMVDHNELLQTTTNETTLGLLTLPQQDRPWLRNPRELLLSTIEVRATFPVSYTNPSLASRLTRLCRGATLLGGGLFHPLRIGTGGS